MMNTNKILSSVAGLAFVGAIALTAPAAHATGLGGSVAGNGGVAGMIGASGSGGANVGAAEPSFGGIGQPGTDLPGPGVSAISGTSTAGVGENPDVDAARQIDRDNRSAVYQAANADRDADIQSQSRAAVSAGLTPNSALPGM